MDPKKFRIAFMGTPQLAVNVLERLVKDGYKVVAVYTQPPRPTGRGYKVKPSPVQEFAESNNLPFFTPTSLKSNEELIKWRELNIDVAIVTAYGMILPKEMLESPKWGALNVHVSLLPRWRGAAPIQRAILAGDEETGITIMKMDEGLDTGDILYQKKMQLNKSSTTNSVLKDFEKLGPEALMEALPLYLSGELKPKPQPSEGITYAQKLNKAEGLLDWSEPAFVQDRKVRALNPWPGTWFDIGEDHIKVLKGEVISLKHNQAPGTILDKRFTIACSENAFRPLVLQKVGKSAMPTEDFLRGYEIPLHNLNDAKN